MAKATRVISTVISHVGHAIFLVTAGYESKECRLFTKRAKFRSHDPARLSRASPRSLRNDLPICRRAFHVFFCLARLQCFNGANVGQREYFVVTSSRERVGGEARQIQLNPSPQVQRSRVLARFLH
jgi:hypothetical protein